MKFSDLKKLKARQELPAGGSAPAPRPAPAPVPAPPAEKPLPAPAAPAPDGLEACLAAEPAKQNGDPARTDRTRLRRQKAAEPEAGPSFRELTARAKDVYSRLIEQAGELLRRIEQPYTEQYDAVLRACRAAAETLKTNPALLNFTAYATESDYLVAHTANTAILSLAIGRAAGVEGAELEFLGFCAMAHDIGMTGYKDLYGSEARLSDEEFSEITMHAEAGLRMLDRIVDLDHRLKERARRVLLQTHERLDGSGYPDRLSQEEIDPFAQIIAIADVYEAMTHPRPWRAAMNPPDVMRELIEKEGRGFSSGTVRALIAVLSIYPPNSLVALSTGEIARVLKINAGSLTKPVVEVLLDAELNPAQPRMLDMLQHPLTSIDRAVSRAEIQERSPDAADALFAARWWAQSPRDDGF